MERYGVELYGRWYKLYPLCFQDKIHLKGRAGHIGQYLLRKGIQDG